MCCPLVLRRLRALIIDDRVSPVAASRPDNDHGHANTMPTIPLLEATGGIPFRQAPVLEVGPQTSGRRNNDEDFQAALRRDLHITIALLRLFSLAAAAFATPPRRQRPTPRSSSWLGEPRGSLHRKGALACCASQSACNAGGGGQAHERCSGFAAWHGVCEGSLLSPAMPANRSGGQAPMCSQASRPPRSSWRSCFSAPTVRKARRCAQQLVATHFVLRRRCMQRGRPRVQCMCYVCSASLRSQAFRCVWGHPSRSGIRTLGYASRPCPSDAVFVGGWQGPLPARTHVTDGDKHNRIYERSSVVCWKTLGGSKSAE